MPSDSLPKEAEIQKAFLEYDREVTIKNFKVACFLGMVLMPAGFSLDFFVYRAQLGYFLALRLLCSALIAIFYAVLRTPLGRKYYRFQGVTLFMLPASCIAWMIYATEGANSPYYAGLNLVLLMLGLVLHWTFRESLSAVLLVIGLYVMACFFHGPIGSDSAGIFFNNLYFLTLTGIIAVTGSYFHSRLRYREFALRHELAASQQMLKESNDKLVELGQVKDRFFANISHELRTPLTLLLSPLETMLNQRKAGFDEDTKNLFGIMHSNGMRLLKLINDLLDLVRLESGRLEVKREPMEMGAFIRGIAAAAQQMADNKGISFQTSVEENFGAVMADRDKLEKVVLNLVFNALKFTPQNGKVELRAFKKEENFILVVEDSGIGIAAKNLPYVFDRFWQADGSSKRKFQGVGIGLSLVKELTEVHGGSVKVESEEGKGTRFTVQIPYVPAEIPAPALLTAPASASNETPQSEEWLANLYRRAELFPTGAAPETKNVASTSGFSVSVLIADDEPDMLRFLHSQLKNQFEVIEANDGKQAVERALEFGPDIILLDMNMPEKDGLQVCRELREHAETRTIPIVMLTARADEQTKLSALSAGANDFLPKPFSTTELHVRIKNLLESHTYQERLADKNKLLEQTIEQLKQTEMQLVQTEKMASMGRMSAGIIHEINNPLNYAATGLYTLRKKGLLLPAEQQPLFAEVLKDVEDGIDRVKNIVLDLRKFTHQDNGHPDRVDVSQVINSALRFLSSEWRGHVSIEVNLPPNQTVFASQNRLLQVLINLLQNGIDAVKEKSFAGDERPTIWITGSVSDDKSVINIRDNGPGIEEKDRSKIFDPFFTTKDVGQGMGLGLSICYQIVHDYGGQILVASEPGKFAEFTLEFRLKR